MTKIYISPDLHTTSSGGTVSKQELLALESLGDKIVQIGNPHMNPINFGLPNHPFLQDYLTLENLSHIKLKDVDMAHLYAGPFTQTVRYLKANRIHTILTIDAHDRYESIKEFENLGYQYPYNHIRDEKLWKIYNGAVHNVDVVITPSKISAEFLQKEGVRPNKIIIIPHGTNIPDSKEIEPIGKVSSRILKTEFTVGYLGQYGPDKGVKYLIEAWSSLNYKDSELLLGGSSANQGLEPFIRKYSTGGKFSLMGWIENIHTFYNLCSIYVQPSVTEGWGIEVVEAMAHGRPVIASDGCGAADCIENGETGFIVPKRDPKAIADKIDWFKNHTQELYLMGGRCKEVAKKYSWDKIRKRYIDAWYLNSSSYE